LVSYLFSQLLGHLDGKLGN